MNHMTRLLLSNYRVPVKKCIYECKRNLLSPASLGLDRFIEAKKAEVARCQDRDKFLKEMEFACEPSSDTLVFTNDIKKTVMLITENNIGLVQRLLKKFSRQNETLKFQKYVFGPDIMKLYHLHNKPIEALALVEDKDTVHHFLQITSFTVLADLLFVNGMYQDVVCVYHYFHTKTNIYKNAVQAMVVLFFAACYKMNTKASLEEAIKLWEKLDRRDIKIHKRALSFFALLALNQGKAQVAVEALYYARPDPIVLSIKAMSLAKSRRFESAFELIKNAFIEDSSLILTTDAINFIKNEMTNDAIDNIPKFQELIDQCKSNGNVTKKSLDDLLFEDVDVQIVYRNINREKRMSMTAES